ncbi:hypothetical protein [Vallitalea sp.]|nr:hypothetical protein [Vallitalea sp.]MCT4688393.1 hypothetical protein [Vallitalea sp.]
MIEDTINLDCYMYDFRGVFGDLDSTNLLYGHFALYYLDLRE